jgi:hypothetical protein
MSLPWECEAPAERIFSGGHKPNRTTYTTSTAHPYTAR